MSTTSPTPPALTPREIAAALRSAPSLLRAEWAAWPDAALRFHPAPGEWCALDVVGHLIEAEARGFAGRVRAVLAAPDVDFQSWDPDEVSRARRDCVRPAAALLDEFARAREASVTLVETLRPDALGRGGRHPRVGRLSIGDLLSEWLHHDRTHVKQILANVQAYVWPHMGNAQRFSQPGA